MKFLKITFILSMFLGTLLFTMHADAMDPDSLMNNLPRKWEGTFTWYDTTRPVQKITVDITEISIDADGNVIALGDGVYYKEQLVEFSLKWSINPETLRFEMWESAPKPAEGIVTDGSHVGKISSDLDKIEAVWISINDGKLGDLFLQPKK